MEPNENTPHAKTPRHRSPNYPGVGLKAAVDKISDWYKKDGLVATPRDAALIHMGFEKFTGDAGRLMSALKSFGLIQEADGRLKLTPRAVDIVARQDGDPKKAQALKEAASGPPIYKDLLKAYAPALPSDPTLKSELIASKGFNPKSVDDFIKDFRATLKYAGVSESTVLDSEHEEEKQAEPPPATPAIGDYVQWESQGVLQFPEPRRIRGFSDDGGWVFLEGSGTGVPADQLTVVEAPPSPPKGQSASKNPPVVKPQPIGVRQDLFSLSEGTVSIQWPATLSAESFQDLSAWLDILKRKIGRSVEFKITKRDVIAKLRAGWRINGDPESEAPCMLVDPNQPTSEWGQVVPVDMLRALLEDGILAPNQGTGMRYFTLG